MKSEKEGYRRIVAVARYMADTLTERASFAEAEGAILILCNAEGWPIGSIVFDLQGNGRMEVVHRPVVTMWKGLR